MSQFILEPQARTDFFESIAGRLKPGGFLASSDLASDVNAKAYDALLRNWLIMMLAVSIPAAGLEQMREACARDVAILPPVQVAARVRAGGFDEPVAFCQAGLIHAWFSRRL